MCVCVCGCVGFLTYSTQLYRPQISHNFEPLFSRSLLQMDWFDDITCVMFLIEMRTFRLDYDVKLNCWWMVTNVSKCPDKQAQICFNTGPTINSIDCEFDASIPSELWCVTRFVQLKELYVIISGNLLTMLTIERMPSAFID